MMPNALITNIDRISGQRADGTPALTAIVLKGSIPVRIVDPHEGHRRAAQANGVEVDRVALIDASSWRVVEYDPQPRDRITFQISAMGETFAAETMMISSVTRSNPGAGGMLDVFTVMLVSSNDGATA